MTRIERIGFLCGCMLGLAIYWSASCAIPVRLEPVRVEMQNAPTADGRPAPFQIAATGSATVEGSTPSGTFAGKVVFDAGTDQAAPTPQPAPGFDWLSLVLGALGLATGGGGVALWIARALAVARQVSAAREAYAEDIEDLAKKQDPDLVKEIQGRHRYEQVKRRIHTKVQKARGKA